MPDPNASWPSPQEKTSTFKVWDPKSGSEEHATSIEATDGYAAAEDYASDDVDSIPEYVHGLELHVRDSEGRLMRMKVTVEFDPEFTCEEIVSFDPEFSATDPESP